MRHRHRRVYRSRDAMILGVCGGLAEHFDVSVFWVRVAFVFGVFSTAFFPVALLYLIAAFLMPLKPVQPIQSEEEQEFYDSYTHSSSMALHRLKRTFDRLDRRIQRMEDKVTGAGYDWERRLKEER